MSRYADDATLQQLQRLERQNQRLTNQVAAAKAVVQRGVDLMHHTQVGQWEGVRGFLEQETDDYEPFDEPEDRTC